MLVICEDCAKKYNIDESRIRGNRARFTCNECGHIIIVDKADLNRSLISSANRSEAPSTTSSSPTSSIDLLREMEAPLNEAPVQESKVEEQPEKKCERKKPHWKYRGIPVFAHSISIVVFSFICVSLVTVYLYNAYFHSEHLADIPKALSDYHEQFILLSSLAFIAVWLFLLLVFAILGKQMHKKFKHLVRNANQIADGEDEIDIVKKGPQEVRDLAFALDRIRQKLRSRS